MAKAPNILKQRMLDLGFKDITDFYRQQPKSFTISFETVRRAVNEDRQNIDYHCLGMLMRALDFTPQEISAELERRGDVLIPWIASELTSPGLVLSGQEKRLVKLLREVADPKVTTLIINVTSLALPKEKDGF